MRVWGSVVTAERRIAFIDGEHDYPIRVNALGGIYADDHGYDRPFWTLVYDRRKRWWFVRAIKTDGLSDPLHFAGLPYGGKNRDEAIPDAERIASKWDAVIVDPRDVDRVREAVGA